MVHLRHVIHVIDEGIILLDRVDGAGEHDAEWRLHFDPRWRVKEYAGGTFLCKKVLPAATSKDSISSSLCSANAGSFISFTAESDTSCLDIGFLSRQPSDGLILQGSMDPMAGWYSRYYGSKEPAPTLIAKMKVQLPATMLTAIKPAGKRLTLPHDLPQALLGIDMFNLLLSDEFSAFANLCE